MTLPCARLALIAALVALAACDQALRTADVVSERTVGASARTVIEPALAGRVPDPARAAGCIVSNATPGELAVIAADATSMEGPAPDVAQLISDILQRPEVAACAAGTSANQ